MLTNKFDLHLKLVAEQKFPAPDAESFLQGLHQVRKEKVERQRGFMNGIAAGVLVLILGLFTFAQLEDNPKDMMVFDPFPITYPDYETETFIYDMADYLIQETDDIWETLAFLDGVDFKPVTSLLEE